VFGRGGNKCKNPVEGTKDYSILGGRKGGRRGRAGNVLSEKTEGKRGDLVGTLV